MTKDNNANLEAMETELRAKIEAELREKIKAEAVAEQEAKVKELEDKLAKQEAKLEKEFVKQEKSIKEMLDKEPKKSIFIPENPLNPNEVVPVGLNGVIYAIPTGQEFEVPQSIYNIWKYSYEKTRDANKRMDEVLTKEIKILS